MNVISLLKAKIIMNNTIQLFTKALEAISSLLVNSKIKNGEYTIRTYNAYNESQNSPHPHEKQRTQGFSCLVSKSPHTSSQNHNLKGFFSFSGGYYA
jgi:hypothetical protein